MIKVYIKTKKKPKKKNLKEEEKKLYIYMNAYLEL